MNTVQFFIDKHCFEACDLIDGRQSQLETKLFELQMFLVDLGNGQNEWYASLQSAHDGKKHYFKSWSGLFANLQVLLVPNAQLEVLKALLD